jgi:hypothetical protein
MFTKWPAGVASEGLLVELLHGLDLATHRGDLRRQLVDDFLDAFFLAGEIQNKQSFVAFHGL